MKKVIYILACIISLSACKQKETKTTNTTQEENAAEYALPLDTAVAYTQRYNALALEILKDSAPIKAYTIRAVDLMEALGMPLEYASSAKYSHVRVYIGMDSNNKFRLLLTPVEGADIIKEVAGNDIILKGLFTSGTVTSGDPVLDGEYVMDFTGPCPNSCSTYSPLNYNNK
jgi:hypothetical protein